MGRENSDQNKSRIKLQVTRRRRGSVSRAYWPAKMRAYTLTNKPAQRRRMLMLHTLGSQDTVDILRLCKRLGLVGPITITHIVQFALALSLIGMVMILSTFYQWSHIVILTLICMLTTIVVTHLLFKPESAQQVNNSSFASTQFEQFIPKSAQNNQLPLSGYFFPDTPMPATPLIRVLETIDLSSTNVEHFLDINAQTPPKTRIDIYEPPVNQPEISYQGINQEDCQDML